MNLKKYWLCAVLAVVIAPPAEAQGPPAGPTTHVLVTLTMNPEVSPGPEIMNMRQDEVRATLNLYLDGKITQWYRRADPPGVMLIMSATSIPEAEALINELPFHKADVTIAEYVELSPMTALRVLLAEPMGAR